MKVFDKASWQIDNGIAESIVVAHFRFIFKWLNDHGMLSADGIEILEIGIDSDVSLHEGLVNEKGLNFLNGSYDKLISDSKYEVSCEKELLKGLFEKM